MNRILITGIFAFTILSSCRNKKKEMVSPILSPITEAVFAPGHVEAAHQFTLTALNDGYISQVLVQEGDNIAIGQTLFAQDNTTASIQQVAATENLDIAEKQAASNSAVLQQLQAQLSSANQKLQNDKNQMERMQRLYTTNSVAKVELDNAELSYNNSVNNVSAIQQNIEATKLSLQQAVINSRSQQQTASANTSYFDIKSPGNYKVFALLKKKGELVRKGEAVAILGEAKDLIIQLTIDEASIAKIKLQQKVLVELNTEKGKTYTASVSKIYPVFDAALQAYKIEAVFDGAMPQIINGTLLQANIIVVKKDRALLIPRSCLGADGKVLLHHDKRTDTVAIQTGIISNEWVEVLNGLTTNDKIIKTF
jgi:HlyD family secretion protein